jgi:anhydro-N-acetylmuramic acid kinase
MALYIGLMSGTSLDGVDGVLADLDARDMPCAMAVLAHCHAPFPEPLRQALLSLNASGADELHRAALAGNALMRVYGAVVDELLRAGAVQASRIRAIGAHGQTVRHRPQQFDGVGYTLQLMNGALLAETCGVDVICDFRSRDLAAGGQGAPLVPAFHAALFGRPDESVAVLNLGGIGNLTLLPAPGAPRGFDCGPGNVLLDAWCQRHRGEAYDEDGRWAASGTVHPELLQCMLEEPFLARQPPKSTGRDLFNPAWLDAVLRPAATSLTPADVQATLAEFSVCAAAQALQRSAPQTSQLLVCGGGAFNSHLMRRLAANLPRVEVQSTAHRGVPPEQVEALAFAWLARAFDQRQPGNLACVTGARGPRVLGALYPAGRVWA